MGIDAGTSQIKVVLYDLSGNIADTNSCVNKVIKKNINYVEMDMGKLWNDLAYTIRELINKSRIDPHQIQSVGLTGQGEGCWLIDKHGNPVSNAILWCDGRAQELVDDLKKDKFLCNEIKKITGSHIFPGATTIIFKWLKQNNYELIKNAKHILYCKDWLRYKLTGKVYSEFTDASTSLLDLGQYKYSQTLFKLLDIEECLPLLPELIDSCQIAGYVSPEASQVTGLIEGTPVGAGMMDIVATAVGTGAIEINDCCTILGTTCCNEIVRDNYINQFDDTSGSECHAIKGLYLNVIASMAGTTNLDWIIENLFQEELKECRKRSINIFEFLESKMKNIPPGSNGLIYHPYISAAGERAPFYNPNAKAQFFGISDKTTKYDLLKSVYEGIAYSIKDCLSETEEVNKIYLAGGGSKSQYWAQIISDCLGKEVIILEGKEFTAKGAAISAGVAIKIYPSIKKASINNLRMRKRLLPNSYNNTIYNDMFDIYKTLRNNNNSIWNLRSEYLNIQGCDINE